MRLLLLLALLALLPLLGHAEEPLPPFPAETADSFPGITALPRVADRPPLRVAALGDPQDLTEPLLPDGLAPPGQPPQEFSPPAGRKLPPGAKPGPLQQLIFTATELRLLHYLASHPGRVFTRNQLLGRVIGEDVFVVDRNIDVHIRSVRQKLAGYRDLIETIRGVGYRFRDEKE